MKNTINFGNTMIDAFKYGVQGNVILGTRSAGKTFTGKYIAESLMDCDIAVTIIDPIGVWRHMQEANPNNDNGKAYKVIVVGKDGDIELHPSTIEHVMRIALKTRSSVVIDLFDVSIIEYWDEIVDKVLSVLLYENKNYGLRHLIVEEASEFIHQQGKKTPASVIAERLTRLSGNVKVGATFINQNAESMSKAVLKLCDGRIIGRQTEKNSLDMVRNWLWAAGVSNADEIAKSLPVLESGEFYVWNVNNNNPIKVKVPMIRSSHPSRNTITELDRKPADDFDTVVGMMNEISFQKQGNIDTTLIVENILSEKSDIVIFTDWQYLKTSDSLQDRLDYALSEKARKTVYGATTVKSFVDRVVTNGYNRLEATDKKSGVIWDDNNNHFRLYDVEFFYALALLKRSELL